MPNRLVLSHNLIELGMFLLELFECSRIDSNVRNIFLMEQIIVRKWFLSTCCFLCYDGISF